MAMTEVFYSLVLTSSIGFLLAVCRLFYKSKCQTIEISYKGIRIVRDTINEEKLDEIQISHQTSNKENNEEKV
jgi:hypothetical protein